MVMFLVGGVVAVYTAVALVVFRVTEPFWGGIPADKFNVEEKSLTEAEQLPHLETLLSEWRSAMDILESANLSDGAAAVYDLEIRAIRDMIARGEFIGGKG